MVYLDYNSTTPLSDGVKKCIIENLDEFINPSGITIESQNMRHRVDKARGEIAELFNAPEDSIIFTSGATESNNTVIYNCLQRFDEELPHIIVSSVEHSAVLKTVEYLAKIGKIWLSKIPVDESGRISIDSVRKALTANTVLVSVMLANNEIGNIYPVREITKCVHDYNKTILVHTDATQAVGKMQIDVDELGVDFMSFSGHKFHAPKGVGGLYIRDTERFVPFIHGGHQEKGLRAGTENVMAILAMGVAAVEAKVYLNEIANLQRVRTLRDEMQEYISKFIPNSHILGDKESRLCNTLCFYIEGIDGKILNIALNSMGYCVSSGSACDSTNMKPSHVMEAMGIHYIPIRVSIGNYTTETETRDFCRQLLGIIKHRKVGNKNV